MISCIYCLQPKEQSEMVKDKTKKGGIRKYCKLCHKKRMIQSRIADPQKAREVSIKSYRKNFEKNREAKNARGRQKYSTDQIYRKSKLTREKERARKKREKPCVICGGRKPKHSIKFCNDCRGGAYQETMKRCYERSDKDTIRQRQNEARRREIAELTDGYIIMQIKHRFPVLRTKDISGELIEMIRASIKVKRTLKQL